MIKPFVELACETQGEDMEHTGINLSSVHVQRHSSLYIFVLQLSIRGRDIATILQLPVGLVTVLKVHSLYSFRLRTTFYGYC